MGKEYNYENAFFAPKTGHSGWGSIAFDIRKKGVRVTHLYSSKFGFTLRGLTSELVPLPQESKTPALKILQPQAFEEIVGKKK
jgi:hypothetical protein